MPRLIAGGPGKRKRWHAWVDGKELTVRFGKVGSSGQATTKSFATEEAAAKELAKLVKQKLSKGYEDDARASTFDSGLALVEVVDNLPIPPDASLAHDEVDLGEGSWSGAFWHGPFTLGLKKNGAQYTAGLIDRSGPGPSPTWRPFAPALVGASFPSAFDSPNQRLIIATGHTTHVIDCDTLARTTVTSDGDAIEDVALTTDYAALLRKNGKAVRLELYAFATKKWTLVHTIACHRQDALSALGGGRILVVGWAQGDDKWDGKNWPTTHFLGIDGGKVRALGSNGMAIDYAFEHEGRSLFANASFGLMEIQKLDEAMKNTNKAATPKTLA